MRWVSLRSTHPTFSVEAACVGWASAHRFSLFAREQKDGGPRPTILGRRLGEGWQYPTISGAHAMGIAALNPSYVLKDGSSQRFPARMRWVSLRSTHPTFSVEAACVGWASAHRFSL